MSRSVIWRTISPTASMFVRRIVLARSVLPTYLPVFTSMTVRASVRSTTM